MHPRDPILHTPRDQKRGIRNIVCADTDMALLDEAVGSLHGGGHVQARHDDAQASPAEARRAQPAHDAEGGVWQRGQRRGQNADRVQLGDQGARQRESGRVVRREETEHVGEFSGLGWGG